MLVPPPRRPMQEDGVSHSSHHRELRDERALMGRTAGVLWLVAATAAGFGAVMPGAPPLRGWVFGLLEAFVLTYAVLCMRGTIRWADISMRGHAIGTGLLLPLIGGAIWATGQSTSYLQPLVLFPLLHIAYFFPLRMSVPLTAELIAVYASPLLYDHEITRHGFPSHVLTFAVTATVLTATVRALKERLLTAERRQREMARTDALTGLANRRGFDLALADAVAYARETASGRRTADLLPGAALLLIDLDGFKLVNDSRGHAAGDELLKTVAAHCGAAVRPADTLARIGGDEFAVVAPGAGAGGAERLSDGLRRAIAAAGAHATIAWAVCPDDAEGEDALLRTADRRLYEGKAARHAGPGRLALEA